MGDVQDREGEAAEEARFPDLTPAQAQELDRRIAAYGRDLEPGRPWREVLDELQQRGCREGFRRRG